MVNAYWEPLAFQFPGVATSAAFSWRRCVDTALPSPDDIQPWPNAATVTGDAYVVQPRSVVLLARALEEDT